MESILGYNKRMSDIITEPLPQEELPIVSPEAAARKDDVSHLAIKDRFNIDIPTDDEQKKLAEIWAFAKGNANSEEIKDIIWEVIHLQGVIGAPRMGERTLDKLYRYVSLRRQEAKIKSDLQETVL